MFFWNLVFALIFISTVAGQSTTPAPASTPSPSDVTCITACLDVPVIRESGTSCQFNNTACLCNDSRFINEVELCLVRLPACKDTPYQVSGPAVERGCAQYGVTVHLDLNAVSSSVSHMLATGSTSSSAPKPTNGAGARSAPAHIIGVGCLMALSFVAAVL